MDIGTYEKILNEDMGKDNFVTIGQIYKTVIDKERKFEYNGEDVEAIPYITDEIISRIEIWQRKASRYCNNRTRRNSWRISKRFLLRAPHANFKKTGRCYSYSCKLRSNTCTFRRTQNKTDTAFG